MYREAWRNIDRLPLHADHTRSRAVAGPNALADRLIRATCNMSRGDGTRRPPTAHPWARQGWTRDWLHGREDFKPDVPAV